jgi:hypothetical protein
MPACAGMTGTFSAFRVFARVVPLSTFHFPLSTFHFPLSTLLPGILTVAIPIGYSQVCFKTTVYLSNGRSMKGKPIKRHDYPELDAILWDRDEDYVDPKVAFRLYEERWRFVDQMRLQDNERALITELARIYGHGHMLVA